MFSRPGFLLFLVVAAGACLGQRAGSENHARRQLGKAERLEEKGKFENANAVYRKIARENPETVAGGIAAERAKPGRIMRHRTIIASGPGKNRVDIVIMGDGFTIENKKQEVYDGMAKRVARTLLMCPTFREYKNYFNLHVLNLSSKEDGVDTPRKQFDTALDAKASGGLQGQTTVDHGLVRRFLDEIEGHDSLAIVLVRLGKLGTGGGGIAVIGGEAGGTALHELVQAFSGLGDEYSTNTGHRRSNMRTANVTTDPEKSVAQWSHWFGKSRLVGFFEGAGGRVKGAWKPTVGSRNCQPCRSTNPTCRFRLGPDCSH